MYIIGKVNMLLFYSNKLNFTINTEIKMFYYLQTIFNIGPILFCTYT